MSRSARRRVKRGLGPPRPLRLEGLAHTVDLGSIGPPQEVEVRGIRPSRARKAYICPGCQNEIAPGTAHIVVVPREAPDLRRHWHTPCWQLRDRRPPGR